MKFRFRYPLCLSLAAALIGLPVSLAHAQETGKTWYEEIWDIIWPSETGQDQLPEVPAQTQDENSGVLQIGDWPVISLERSEMTVEENAGLLEIPVRKDLLTDRRVSVSYSVSTPGTTEAVIEDIGDGQIVFRGDQDLQVIRLRVLDNTQFNPGRTALVTLSDVIGGEIGQSTLLINILENDPEPAPEKEPGKILAEPAAVDFGEPLSGLIVERTVKITNNGEATVYINRVDETSDNVSIEWMDCASTNLLRNTSCSIELSYTAGAEPVSGSLLVSAETDTGVLRQAINLEVPLQGRVTKPVDRRASDEEIRMQRISRVRAMSEPDTISTVEIPVAEPPKKYRMSQSDISDENSPGRRQFDFPVDLSRVITTFTPIPCVIQETINTQLAGTISCKIEQPILGHHAVRHGRALVLLEPETMAEGIYETLTEEGQTRTNVAWQRFMRPDGSSLYLKNGFPGRDAMGRMGLHGPIENHVFEKVVSPLALSAIVAGGTELLAATNGTLSDASQTIIVDGTTRVIGDMLDRTLNLPSIMTIPARSRLLIKPTTDLYFKETEIVALNDPDGVMLEETRSATQASADPPPDNRGGGRSLAAQPTVN